MKKFKNKNVITYAVWVIFGLMLIFGLFVFVSNLIVLDRSAEFVHGGLQWKNAVYIPCSGEYTEVKTIAKTSDGKWNINSVKEDNSHTFVVVRSFLDQQLFVREDYVIPRDGEVTAIAWDGIKITDYSFCQAVNEIYTNDGETFEYNTEGIFMLTETQRMRKVYFSYENCPVAVNSRGWMGKINNQWVITLDLSDQYENGAYQYTCKIIPEQYSHLLEKYFTA